jgi:hypothetical protein
MMDVKDIKALQAKIEEALKIAFKKMREEKIVHIAV